ncbi:hypothetical protein LBMAG18_03890 [Alphaproteobacteria bacterium]|nr:hypothetical protein LBMAG18_03890 [Alphaproteobacteria bacterium]
MKQNKQKRFSKKSFNNKSSDFKKKRDFDQYRSDDSNNNSQGSFGKSRSTKFSKNFKNSQKLINDDSSSQLGFRGKNKKFSRNKDFANSRDYDNDYNKFADGDFPKNIKSDRFERSGNYRNAKDRNTKEGYGNFRNSSSSPRFSKKPSRFRDFETRDSQNSSSESNRSSSKKWQDFRQLKKNIFFEKDLPSRSTNFNDQKSSETNSAKKNTDSSRLSYFIQPFHLAIPVNNLEEARKFYGEFLGFSEGRSNEHWVDWNFFGHQLVTHLRKQAVDNRSLQIVNEVDDQGVPVPHFGVVLTWNQWHDFADKLKQAEIKFVIEPYIRFKDQIGEQATMFFYDPSGNAMEFKAFKDISQLFAKYSKKD